MTQPEFSDAAHQVRPPFQRPNLDGSPAMTPVFIAVINGMAATSRGHLIVDTAEAWDGLGYQLVRVPVGTQGVRLSTTQPNDPGADLWWEREDTR